jgi:hypothetical protein
MRGSDGVITYGEWIYTLSVCETHCQRFIVSPLSFADVDVRREMVLDTIAVAKPAQRRLLLIKPPD